ncbi:MAG: type II secretion system protein [Synechococcus sp.]|nr:type II secretion system protein [Synechococcus sp.]
MPLSKNLHKYKIQDGFTLIEILVALFMVGILSAIAAPSFLGTVNRGRVNEAASQLRGMFQNAQREAIKKSQDCVIQLPAKGTENPVITSSCDPSDQSRRLNNVFIQYNGTGDQITVDFKGGMNIQRTIVIYSDNTSHRRCLVISNLIGMIRVGNYIDDNLNNLDGNLYCKNDGV